MATKIIKAWIDGAIQEIEVEDIISPELPLSVEERVDKLEDKHEVIFTDGNFLVGNGTEDLEEITPDEVLEHINGASVATMTSEEFEALSEDEVNANTLYMLTDSEDTSVLYTAQTLTDEQKAQARANIGAIDDSYVVIEPLPISSYIEGTSAIKYNVNVEDLTAGLYAVPYNKNYSKQFVNFFVLCDDGTEKSLFNNLYQEYIYEVYSVSAYTIIIDFNNTRYNIDIADKSTSATVTFSTTRNYDYLGTQNAYEYTPTGDYNPATKKYVDDAVAAVPEQVQSDWNQTDESAVDYIKNKPEIATDDEIITLLTEEDMFPVVTDSDGSILSDENNNILLW